MEKAPKKSELTETKLLQYVGLIALEFSSLEDQLESYIAKELNERCEDIGHLVTCKLTFQQKIELYDRLIHYRFKCTNVEPIRIKMFSKFVGELSKAGEFRNNVIHGIRFNDDDEIYLRQRFSKKMIGVSEGIDELKLPPKGWNSEFPKYKKMEFTKAAFKKYIDTLVRLNDSFDEWWTFPD